MNKELSKEEIRTKWIRQTPLLSLDECVDNAMREFSDLEKRKILDNPELYDLVERHKYYELHKKLQEWINANVRQTEDNKELQEKITELEGVIAKLSQKVILYECNY